MNPLSTITLRHLIIDNSKMIGLEYPNNPTISALVSTLTNVKWSNKYGLNFIANNRSNLDNIFSIFRGVAWVNGKYFFKEKPINLNITEPNYTSIKNKKVNMSGNVRMSISINCKFYDIVKTL